MIARYSTENFIGLSHEGVVYFTEAYGFHTHDDGNQTFGLVAPYPAKRSPVRGPEDVYQEEDVIGLAASPQSTQNQSPDAIAIEMRDGEVFRLATLGTEDEMPFKRSSWKRNGEKLDG